MQDALQKAILALLSEGRDLTLATLMDDGAPHATTVSYANEGLAIYFGCTPESMKAHNLARDPRIAATITLPYGSWQEIRGLSLVGRANPVDGEGDAERVDALFLEKFNELAQYVSAGDLDIRLFEIRPQTISLLDYRLGFGHTERGEVGMVRGQLAIL